MRSCPRTRPQGLGRVSWESEDPFVYRAPIQDRNAGNAGDRLKHALLTEILARLPGAQAWAYGETHAGAGAYVTPNAGLFIRRALEVTAAWRAEGDAETAWRGRDQEGYAYAHVLRLWWQHRPRIPDPARGASPGSVADSDSPRAVDLETGADSAWAAATYPGSPVLAVLGGSVRGELVLAEADLKAAVRRVVLLVDVACDTANLAPGTGGNRKQASQEVIIREEDHLGG